MKPLIVGLGNEIISDDAVGIVAAHRLAAELPGADVVESGVSGTALIDLISGYEQVIIIDAIKLADAIPGEIIELTPQSLRYIPNPSPHYSGLPEVFALAQKMDLPMPEDVRIFAVAAVDLQTIGGEMSEPVKNAMNDLINRIKSCVAVWQNSAEKK